MFRPLRSALLISFIFHGVIICVFLKGQTPPEKSKPIEVQILERKTASGPSGARGKSSGQGKKISGSRLRPKIPIPGPEKTALNPLLDAEARGSGEWPENQWGSHGGAFGEIANFIKYDRLREEIRGLLNYPSILSRRGIEGTVNARLPFTDNSLCDFKRVHITSHERHLGIYILALLKKLCSFEVVKNLKANSHDFIDLSFQFQMVSEATPVSQQGDSDFVVSNVLGFRRTAPKSMLEYHLGPIRGLWFVPAIALDIPWIVEKWDYYVNGVDPMAAFKN